MTELTEQILIKKSNDFFKCAEPFAQHILISSKLDEKTLVEKVRPIFREAKEMIGLIPDLKKIPLEEYKAFFSYAETIIEDREPEIPIKEFQEFCKKTYLPLIKEYRRWMTVIEENDPRRDIEYQTINLLKIFGISGKEEAHSKFLVWLLREDETHGLGNLFLKQFLGAGIKEEEHRNNISIKDTEIVPEAAGESGTPDIKIIGKDFLCIVENKIRSMEGKDQTTRYRNDAFKEIQNRGIDKNNLILIFLTPTGQFPKCDDFKSMNYREIIDLLKKVLQSQTNISTAVRFLIEQFILNLEVEILHDYDLQRNIVTCLSKYANAGDNYLWENADSIYAMYTEILNEEGR